jgi:hypothetical protein
MWDSQILAMRCFHRRETVKVVRERLRAMSNVENDASDAPKMVAILAISHPCSMPDQGTLALAAIPDVESRESTPILAYAQPMNCRGRIEGLVIALQA